MLSDILSLFYHGPLPIGTQEWNLDNFHYGLLVLLKSKGFAESQICWMERTPERLWIYPPAGSCVPGAQEDIIRRACCPWARPALSHSQEHCNCTARLLVKPAVNSLCHNSVYVGPHQSQVLINLCLQRAKGDQVNQASTRQNHPDSWTPLCRQTYLVLVIYNGESKHRHDSWGEKEHTVIFLPITFLQRRDLLQTATNTYHATWSADPPGIFVLKINFAQTSQIWYLPLLWD